MNFEKYGGCLTMTDFRAELDGYAFKAEYERNRMLNGQTSDWDALNAIQKLVGMAHWLADSCERYEAELRVVPLRHVTEAVYPLTELAEEVENLKRRVSSLEYIRRHDERDE